MIDQWYLIFFNLMFSAFPQLITGTLDKDVSAETLQELPQLYMSGQNSEVPQNYAVFFYLSVWLLTALCVCSRLCVCVCVCSCVCACECLCERVFVCWHMCLCVCAHVFV